MKKQRIRAAVLLVMFLLAAVVCLIAADRIQRGNGTVEIEEGYIAADQDGRNIGQIYYKLYKPKDASAENPAPGVLLLHGYQNDHETCAAYSVELARRGYAVLAIDEYGHGKTTAGLANRGYVNHKVTVNYGTDSEADGTFKSAGGPVRYRVMMNFSNLSFFDPRYTKKFVDVVIDMPEVSTVFIVTDIAESYRSLCAELPGRRVMQLYESYLHSFEINAIG